MFKLLVAATAAASLLAGAGAASAQQQCWGHHGERYACPQTQFGPGLSRQGIQGYNPEAQILANILVQQLDVAVINGNLRAQGYTVTQEFVGHDRFDRCISVWGTVVDQNGNVRQFHFGA